MCVCYSAESLSNKDINHLNDNVLITPLLISTHPHLNVVSGWVWQLLVEPWRSVEAAARAQRPTTISIPQRVVDKECVLLLVTGPSVTKVIIPNKQRDASCCAVN